MYADVELQDMIDPTQESNDRKIVADNVRRL